MLNKTDTCLYREYAYAPRGEKVTERISGRKFQRTNIVAAKPGDKIIAPMPYSPELNPIENFWSVLKHWLKMHIREFNFLDDAISAAFHIFQTYIYFPPFKWDYYTI